MGPEALVGVVVGGTRIGTDLGGPPPGPNLAHPPKVHPVGVLRPLSPNSTRGPEGPRGAGPLLGSSQPPCMA